jgi:hypothetical protein
LVKDLAKTECAMATAPFTEMVSLVAKRAPRALCRNR